LLESRGAPLVANLTGGGIYRIAKTPYLKSKVLLILGINQKTYLLDAIRDLCSLRPHSTRL
jgi:hypothetical protein